MIKYIDEVITEINVTDVPKRKVAIGHQGEHKFRKVTFDVSEWLKFYPNGKTTISLQRPDGQLYPVVVNASGDRIEYSPSGSDTAIVGDGYIEVRLKQGDVVGKSCKIPVVITEALGEPGAAPDDAQVDWIAEIVAATEEATERAESAATRSETAANNASSSATRAANSATAAAASANDAANAINNMNIDLEADAAAGKLFVVIDGERKGHGAEGVGGGGLGIDDWGTTKDDNDNYYVHLYDKDGEDLLNPLPLPATGGSGGWTGSTVRIINKTGASTMTVGGGNSDVMISYSWTSVDETGAVTGPGSATWYVNSKRVAGQNNIAQGDQTFNIRPHLTEGMENVVKLTVEDGLGTKRSMTWRITVSVFGLTWRLDDVQIVGTGTLNVAMIPSGAGEKVVHLKVDDTEIYTRTVTASGTTIQTVIPAQSHGAHDISAWITATVDGEAISTDPIRSTGVWVESGNNTPIIAIQSETTEVQQYSSVPVSYLVYQPGHETATAELKVNNKTVRSVTVPQSTQVWHYQPTTAGNVTLSVSCAGSSKSITLHVSDIGIDIGEVTDAMVMKLDPSGHSNAESNRESFGYTAANGTNHPLGFSPNFDWVNGGFQTDEDGTALVVKRGTYATLDTSFFSTFVPTQGKEIKIVFKSKNVRNYDAQLLKCYPVEGQSGIVINAQNATLYSSANSANAYYVEERKIEIDFNIESNKEDKLAVVWLKGIPSSAFPYGNDTWSQVPPASAPEKDKVVYIGSEDADVWIYLIRMYNSSLQRADILANYIADAGDGAEMIARYNRNNIFTSGSSRMIDINKLKDAAPNLRIIQITADDMTESKSDKIKCTVQHFYPAGQLADGTNPHNWSAENVTMKAQGTSSLDYIASALNLDLDFSKAQNWEDENGNAMTGYAMTDHSIPVAYFNLKANVASSENANNVILADDYNNYDPYIVPARQADARVRDTVEGHPVAVFFTNNGTENVMLGSRQCTPGTTMLYFVGDMNNSKKNNAVFGQVANSAHPLQCCIEITNNNNDATRFAGPINAVETFAGKAIKKGDDHDDDFEFRYPDGEGTPEMIAAFKEMHAWVVSTRIFDANGNRGVSTGKTLSPYVVYNGVTYTTDNDAYREAKFKNEVGNYFATDSLLWHYLFTERHCMVDNRAKNTFVSYEWDNAAGKYLWNWRCDYDNDTAEGNDNSGGLTFTYGLEDTDEVAGAGSGHVFNAHDSTIWVNVREFMSAELRAMYINRESAGAWDATRILNKFLAHQQARPEALDIEDMWGKYFTPYTEKGNTDFIKMMLGRKEYQREQFEVYQEEYVASKYGGALWVNDFIGLRGNSASTWTAVEPSTTLTITPYADMYLRVDFGNAATSRHVRAKRGVPTTVITDASFNRNDLEIQIRGASKLSAISGLAAYYSKKLVLTNARKLIRLEFGAGGGYINSSLDTSHESFSIDNCPLLEYVDLRGLPNAKVPLNLNEMTFLKEIYADNSGFTEATFAENAKVEIVYLPALTGLTARGLTSLQTFSMAGSRLSSVWIENSPMIDTLALVRAAANLSRVRITGVDWEMDNADVVEPMTHIAGYTATGETTDSEGNPVPSVLTGAAYFTIVTQDELNEIMTAFPDLDVRYGSIVVSHTVTFVNYDGSFLYRESVRHGGAATNPVTAGYISAPTKPPTDENSFVFTMWDQDLSNVQADMTVTALYGSVPRRYTVRWFDADGAVMNDYTVTVEAHEKAVYGGRELADKSVDGPYWMGWDKVTNDVTSDMDVYPVYITPVLPSSVPTSYDYLYSDDPADDSAYTLAEFWGILRSGNASAYFKPKDKVKIVMPTVASPVISDTTIELEVAGFNRQYIVEKSAVGGTMFLMRNLLNATHSMNSSNTNEGGWASSAMRNWLNVTVFPALPVQWRKMIQTSRVRSTAGNTSTDIVTSDDKLFLPSYTEVGFSTASPYVDEVHPDVYGQTATNAVLPIFTDNASRIKRIGGANGTASNWWLRSPVLSASTVYVYVSTAGNDRADNARNASNAHGVAFGFSI